MVKLVPLRKRGWIDRRTFVSCCNFTAFHSNGDNFRNLIYITMRLNDHRPWRDKILAAICSVDLAKHIGTSSDPQTTFESRGNTKKIVQGSVGWSDKLAWFYVVVKSTV